MLRGAVVFVENARLAFTKFANKEKSKVNIKYFKILFFNFPTIRF